MVKINYFDYKFYTPKLIPLQTKFKKSLQKYFEFYQNLTSKNKLQFERRVQYFITVKKFIPRGFEKVTDEMKVLIAASAIQLTFGLPNIYLAHFKKILIYPDTYYSMISKKYHKGEVNPLHGIIVVSWKNFVEGYIINNDGVNLGLHEMAHALRLENKILNNEYSFFDENILKKWNELSILERDKMETGEHDFLRKYAAYDDEEFFAVAVEYFFEKPVDFKNKLPEVYSTLCKLLKQDPLKNFKSFER